MFRMVHMIPSGLDILNSSYPGDVFFFLIYINFSVSCVGNTLYIYYINLSTIYIYITWHYNMHVYIYMYICIYIYVYIYICIIHTSYIYIHTYIYREI